jgi:hypothetical protein
MLLTKEEGERRFTYWPEVMSVVLVVMSCLFLRLIVRGIECPAYWAVMCFCLFREFYSAS